MSTKISDMTLDGTFPADAQIPFTSQSLGIGENYRMELISRINSMVGAPLSDGHIGSFAGRIIPDGSSVKGAFQALETAASRELWVEEFGAVGDGIVDDTNSFQEAIDYCEEFGLSLRIGSGLFKITSQLQMKSGVLICGTGRRVSFPLGAPTFNGSWIIYSGPIGEDNACFKFFNAQFSGIKDIGIFGSGNVERSAIAIGSDNAPASKFLTFERITFVNVDTGVRWGQRSELAPLEQCDDMSFRDLTFVSVKNGFRVNATNSSDYSIIERCGFDNVVVSAFDLADSGLLEISKCSAGFNNSSAIMFKVSAQGPDPLKISLCQSEGLDATFLDYNTTNDQGAIHLESNVINNKIVINGIVRVTSRNNFYTEPLYLTGFARFKSYDDVWVFSNQESLINLTSPAQFSSYAMKDAVSFNGANLPVNFHIEEGTAIAGGFTGLVNTRAGVSCFSFIGGAEYGLGACVRPSVDNGNAYRVIVAGVTGAEPTWPVTPGASVVSGGVTFQQVGVSAILKGYGAIAA